MHAYPDGDDMTSAKPPISILIVEDEVLIRMMMANELRSAGYDVIEAAHADEAMDVLGSSHIHLLITDIAMPLGSMDGIKLAELVRNDWPETKVMVVSANFPEGQAALDAYIGKPIDTDKLIQRIRILLES
jgi:CheY-like chemotaxis protein